MKQDTSEQKNSEQYTSEHHDLLTWVKEESLAAGASDVAVSLSEQRVTKTEIRKGELEKIKNGQSRILSLSIYIDGKFARHTTNKTDKAALSSFIDEAVVATRFINADEFRQLPKPELYPSEDIQDPHKADAAIVSLTPEEMVAKALEAYPKEAESDPSFVSATSRLTCSVSAYSRMHSNGFWGSYQRTSVSVSTEVSLKGDGDQRFEESAYWSGINWADLPDVSTIGAEALQRARDTKGQEKVVSGSYQLILENRISAKFFSILFGGMGAGALHQKRTFLEGKQGKQIVPDFITVRDVANLPKGMGNRRFDEDGLAVKDRAIINKGVFVDWLTSNYYSLKLGREANGADFSNVVFEASADRTFPVEELIAGAESAIWVKSFNGGNSNPVTGDFSFGISGQLIENGKVTQPISEMVMTGNVLSLFENLSAVGDDPYVQSSYQRPTLVFDNVQCSGL